MNTYNNIAKIELPQWPTCEKCGHVIVTITRVYNHEDVCEFLAFRDIEAPKLGWTELIHSSKDNIYIRTALEEFNVPHKTFHMNGSFGHWDELFLPATLACTIDLFYTSDGYAGMGIEEYLHVVLADK